MRRYLSIITEHEDPDMVGLVRIADSPSPTVTKNEERRVETYNHKTGEFSSYLAVGLGYVDFEDGDALEANMADEIRRKLREVDRAWLEKAGVAGALEGASA